MHGVLLKFTPQQVEVELQILNQSVSKIDVAEPQPIRHLLLVLACQPKHFAIAINTDHPPTFTNHLSENVTQLASSRTKVENRLSLIREGSRVATTVIAFQNLVGNHRQKVCGIFHRAAQRLLATLGCGGISPVNGLLRGRCLRNFALGHFVVPLSLALTEIESK